MHISRVARSGVLHPTRPADRAGSTTKVQSQAISHKASSGEPACLPEDPHPWVYRVPTHLQAFGPRGQ
ncbi:hypothetical protein ACQRIU_002309 [Beauveria bassiana]